MRNVLLFAVLLLNTGIVHASNDFLALTCKEESYRNLKLARLMMTPTVNPSNLSPIIDDERERNRTPNRRTFEFIMKDGMLTYGSGAIQFLSQDKEGKPNKDYWVGKTETTDDSLTLYLDNIKGGRLNSTIKFNRLTGAYTEIQYDGQEPDSESSGHCVVHTKRIF